MLETCCDLRPLPGRLSQKVRSLAFQDMRIRLSTLVLPFAAALLLAAGLPARAVSNEANAPHVHVQLVVPDSGLNRGEAASAGFYFKLEPGWHIYWKNAGDAGEPPHVKWTLPDGLTAGQLEFPAPRRLPLGPLMDFGYEDEVLFPLTLNVAQGAKAGLAVLHAKVDWLVCQASCIPGKAELEVSRDVNEQKGKSALVKADADIFNRLSGRLPKPLPAQVKAVFQPTAEGFRLSISTGRKETEAAFFPADQEILDNPAPQKIAVSAKGLILDLKKDANLAANPAQLTGVVELSGGRAFEIAAVPGVGLAAGSSESSSAPAATGAASSSLVGAAPVSTAPATNSASPAPAPVSGSISSPVRAAPKPFSGAALLRAAGLAFLGGLLLNLMPCVFPVLFLKGLALVNSGNEERHKLRIHGFVYAAGIVASFWALVAALLGLRAAGATLGWGFQFQSPVFLELMAGLLFFLGLSLAGQFEIGLTLTSAGGALAAKQGYSGSFFTGVLAVVVATPCTAPFMGAALGYALAQSAVVTFAVFTALALGLAVPYVALTLQPAWTRVLPKPGAWMEVLRQAVAVPIFATVIWLAWVLARAYGADLLMALLASFLLLAIAGWFLGRWPAKRWSAAVAGAVMLCVVAVSVLAPQKLGEAPGTVAATVTEGGWQPWSAEAVSRAQSAGRPVLVDFTAKWCLSCQVNERLALEQPTVLKAFQDASVALFKADWTRHDEAITQALTGMGRSGVPAYALYSPGQSEPELLPEVLTPGIVIDAVTKLPKTATQAVASTSKLK
jgi:thiol:disulfide interchange protein/DsbC/DsbD-like thiol-disulfide interchange protein